MSEEYLARFLADNAGSTNAGGVYVYTCITFLNQCIIVIGCIYSGSG